MQMITGKNYIGNTKKAGGNTLFRTINPVLNKENHTQFHEATPEEINEAVALATEAFASYSRLPGTRRAAFLRAIAEEISALGDAVISTYCEETGLPEGRARGEQGRTVGQLRAFAALLEEGSWVQATIDKAQPERTPLPRADIRKMKVALGPVVVFGASNFPFAFSTAGGDTASALAAGCPVILKGHPMHAGTSELVASAILKAAAKTGMPNGVFSHLNSSGIGVGQQLVKHEGVMAVGFTGSFRGGRALFDLARERKVPIPVFAEMGSINPVVLLPGALENEGERWAKAYAGSITLGSGQFCTNPGLLLGVAGETLDRFISHLADEILAIAPGSMLHPNITDAYEKGKQNALAQENTMVAAAYTEEVQANYARQLILAVDGATFSENPALHQEVFGPFALVVQCEDTLQLERLVSGLEGQLTGTLIGSPDELARHADIIHALQGRVGRLIFNGVPTGVEVCPAMHHGGPYPATTDSRFTSVGTHAIERWVRPVSFQDCPQDLLPDALKDKNPLGIFRMVDGDLTKAPI
jgi:alpha-ketoglutaric semialdehyde dehydrogenase